MDNFTRTKLHRRVRQVGENVLSYVPKLKRLASRCKFTTVELQNVRDHLVIGCFDDKICERLLLEQESLTLENAIVLAQNGAGYLGI